MQERMMLRAVTIAMVALGVVGCASTSMAPQPQAQPSTSFFITSMNPGKGADFGGLAGADGYCKYLADAAGVGGGKTWRAYLSTQPSGSTPAVNAKDRIGKGPWQNAKGVVIAKDVAELHGTNNLNKTTALNERGGLVNSRTETPNYHDIVTGTQPDGTAFPAGDDKTCGNWTKFGDGTAIVGHFDRAGLGTPEAAQSWNSSHPTRGCSLPQLNSTGGGGFLYCFAAN
jgi:hypothetical protein